MKRFFVAVALLALTVSPSAAPQQQDGTRWKTHAANVTIIRDTWGVPHVYGKSDADTVFGVIYAQAEDDFNRVETNYLISLGRLAEAEGEGAIYKDLRYRLINDPDDLKTQYHKAPAWLKALMDAWADGLNFYLSTHPNVKPKVITHFEPWMTLSFSDGSIGPDIEKVKLPELKAFYGRTPVDAEPEPDYVEPTGSNGIAIAPSITTDHHALLWINPHTSFFFREEAQMTSGEGLDAYGAITWGQFFIYQGFNDRTGWMHTTSKVNNVTEYLETVTKNGDGYAYKYGSEERPVIARQTVISYKTRGGTQSKAFTIYSTHHGPIVREQDGKWVAVRLMQEPLKAITQSFTRTKTKNLKEFRDVMELHTNSSNNTIYADADGNIAYFHSNFIPKRDPKFDWTKPVDGSDPATEWGPVMSIDETPHVINPKVGWLYNSNNWPWSVSGPDSPKREDFPAYVDKETAESARGYHALRVLPNRKDFSMDALRDAAYDSYLPEFDKVLPPLLKAYDEAPESNPLKAKLAEQIAMLKAWDHRWSVSSVPTSLAVYYGERAGAGASTGSGRGRRGGPPTGDQLLQALASASDKLTADFGSWKTPWGDINRFQRLTGDIDPPYDDSKPSIPVGFTSSRWGSLASFDARTYPNTKKMYGNKGNSFVAVVEFGDRVRAKAVTAGGLNGDPKSPHFDDQAERYAKGDLREVYFYRPDVEKHAERTYHPGQ
jgi:acyl-homoserine lactone acylase PvdQ